MSKGALLRGIRGMAVAVVLVALASCSESRDLGGKSTPSPTTPNATPSATPTPTAFRVTGTVTTLGVTLDAKDAKGKEGKPGCRSRDGYDDIKLGTQVVVRDAKGEAIALGRLKSGLHRFDEADVHRSSPPSQYDFSIPFCVFPFTVTDVPDGSVVYSVEVAHRGQLHYSRAELNVPIPLILAS